MRPRLIAIATNNRGKLREFQAALAGTGLELRSAADLGVTDFPDETGADYEANALIKARHVTLATGLPALADDSGLEVDALAGAPGVHTARYGGPGLTDAERVDRLLRALSSVPDGERTARFVSVIVLVTPGGAARAFRGESEGSILHRPLGTAGFGYDPVFYSPPLGKSFAEASLEEKGAVSHRGRALAAFAAWAKAPAARAELGDAPAA